LRLFQHKMRKKGGIYKALYMWSTKVKKQKLNKKNRFYFLALND